MALILLVLAWLLTYLVHSSILLAGAWLLSAARVVRSPVAREVVWKVCLVGGILTATVYSLSPYQPYAAHVLLPSAQASARGSSVLDAAPSMPVANLERASALQSARRSSVRTMARSAAVVGAPMPATPTPDTQHLTPSSWPRILLGLWGLGAGILVVRLVVQRRRLARSLRGRREIAGGPLALMLESLRAAAGVRRRIRLTASAELAGPVAMGASEICLPERALTALDPDQQRAVLAHELGHLVRQDPLWLGVAAACESLFFFQPLNRLARRRIQEAAEYLCDDWAVHQTGGSLTLAKCLAEVATWMDAGARAVPVAGMAENRSQLVDRVHRLVEGVESPRGLRMAVPVAALALSSMAFAAPGVSPPCEQADQAPVARASTGASARAAWQGDSQNWVTIRDGRVLVFHDGFAPRLTGQGQLGIRDGGRMIELKEGQRLLVNGREPRDDGIVEVCETMSLAIVGRDGQTLWRIEPVRVAREQTMASAPRPDRGDWDAAAARAEGAMGRAGDQMDSLDDAIDSAGDVLDTLDVAEIARNAAEVSAEVTSAVTASLAPQIARLQELGVRIGSELAPRMAELGARIAGRVVPAILQGLCDGGLCDDSAPPVKRHKVYKPRP
jgi:beta-lactamase regulating signal transducer with metallopeptidase domain